MINFSLDIKYELVSSSTVNTRILKTRIEKCRLAGIVSVLPKSARSAKAVENLQSFFNASYTNLWLVPLHALFAIT